MYMITVVVAVCCSICSLFVSGVAIEAQWSLRNDCLKFDPRRRGVPQVYFIESKWDEPVPESSPSQGDDSDVNEKILRTILIALST